MPLSDREQHLLDQLEQQLSADDPKFASHMRGAASPLRRGRVLVAAASVVVGLVLVLLAINLAQTWVGAIGFVVIVAGIAYAASPPRNAGGPAGVVQSDGTTKKPRRAAARAGFMDRLEERWERRRNGW